MFAAVLDTCVLWPSLQRDFLLSLAAEGVYRPLWSDRILEELEYEEARKLEARGATTDDARARATALIGQMNGAFDDSCVTGWERLDGTYGLPDPDDEHVVAAAEFAGAGAIVTMNTKHFPYDHLPSSIGIQTPTQFALNTVQVSPTAAAVAVRALADRSGRQGRKRSPQSILDDLDRIYSMNEATALIRPLIS